MAPSPLPLLTVSSNLLHSYSSGPWARPPSFLCIYKHFSLNPVKASVQNVGGDHTGWTSIVSHQNKHFLLSQSVQGRSWFMRLRKE